MLLGAVVVLIQEAVRSKQQSRKEFDWATVSGSHINKASGA
jgi:hypothetical protein